MKTTWDKMFGVVAARLTDGCKERLVLQAVNEYAYVRFEVSENLQRALNECEAYSGYVDIRDFKKIGNQFVALGLIEIEPDKQGSERDAVWKLSAGGAQLMRQNELFWRNKS